MTQEAEKNILELEPQLEELRKGRPGQLVVQLGSVGGDFECWLTYGSVRSPTALIQASTPYREYHR